MGGSRCAGGSVLSYIKVEDGARHRVNCHACTMLWWKYKSTIFLLQVIWGHPQEVTWFMSTLLLYTPPTLQQLAHTRNLFNIRMNHDNNDHLDAYIINQNIHHTTSLLGKWQWQQHRLEMWHVSSPTQVTMSPSWPYHSTTTSEARARHKGYGWGSSWDARLELGMLFIYLFFISTLLIFICS